MKRTRALLIAVLLLALVLPVALSGCSFLAGSTTTTKAQSTTTSVAGQQTPIDQAIAAITKSTSVATPQTVRQGTLLAGSDVSFPPLESTIKGGKYQGFDVDLCTAIAKKLGLTLEVIQKEYKDLPGGLNSNAYDMVMSALPITSDLTAKMDFSNAYLPGTLSITTQSGSSIANSAGLSGKIVGVQIGTLAQTQLAKTSGIKQIKTYDRVLNAFSDLQNSALDAVVTDQVVSAYVLKSYAKTYGSKLANSGTIDTGIGYGYAVKKGNTALLGAINAALAELRTDGIYKQICDKWGVTGN